MVLCYLLEPSFFASMRNAIGTLLYSTTSLALSVGVLLKGPFSNVTSNTRFWLNSMNACLNLVTFSSNTCLVNSLSSLITFQLSMCFLAKAGISRHNPSNLSEGEFKLITLAPASLIYLYIYLFTLLSAASSSPSSFFIIIIQLIG